jgi:oligoribonuclease
VKTDKLVLVDVEATGLDEDEDAMLELGIQIRNKDLGLIAEKSWLIHPDGWKFKLQNAKPIVIDMHLKSGLTGELFDTDDGFAIDYQQAEVEALRWLFEQLPGIEPGEYPMVGSNVANYDRKFLHRRMPGLESWFHYRNMDVSSIRVAMEFFDAELAKAYNDDPRFQKDNAVHRVLADCNATVESLKFFRDNLFGVEMLDD